MADTKIKFYKNSYTSTELLNLCGVAGNIVFDNNTKRIYVGTDEGNPSMYGASVRDVEYDSTNNILTISKIDGTTVSINFTDGTSADAPSSVLRTLRDDINTNRDSILIINGSGEGSVNKKINDTVDTLSGSASISSKSGNVVTIKSGISEIGGVIENTSVSDIVLSPVAATGSANDVILTYKSESSDVQTTITNIDARISTLENATSVSNIVCNPIAEEIPYGAIYDDGTQQITGTMVADNTTMSSMYLVKTMINGEPAFEQYITVRSTTTPYTYSWQDIGSTKTSLSGYAKSVTTNNQEFSAGSGTTIALPNIITSVVGESEISGGVSDYTSIDVSSIVNSGTNIVTLNSKIKVQDVSTASSMNNGIALSNDVKNYIKSQLTIIRTYTEEDI